MNPPGKTGRITDPSPDRRERNGCSGGFTLIEITIVLLLIGILSALGLTIYRGMLEKARMTQAKTTLAHLARMEAIYFSNNDRYTDNVVLLDYDPVKYDFYRVTVVLDNSSQNYTGIATGTGPMEGDWWTVTKLGVPIQSDNSAFK